MSLTKQEVESIWTGSDLIPQTGSDWDSGGWTGRPHHCRRGCSRVGGIAEVWRVPQRCAGSFRGIRVDAEASMETLRPGWVL